MLVALGEGLAEVVEDPEDPDDPDDPDDIAEWSIDPLSAPPQAARTRDRAVAAPRAPMRVAVRMRVKLLERCGLWA
ncbi:hypothetical protein GCM10027519_48000 [Kineococcus endophyticus]